MARASKGALLTAAACMSLCTVHTAAAQTSFEWADTAVRLAQYTNTDECLAAAERVRNGLARREALRMWRDTMPPGMPEVLEPAPAPVTRAASSCAARFVEPATDLHDFASLLALYLEAGRDSDATALVARRLAAVPQANARERASVADSAVHIYVGARPARLAAAEEILLHRAHASTDRVERLKTYFELMQSASNAGDTARVRRAAQWMVKLADSLTVAERQSDAFENLGDVGGRIVLYDAMTTLTGLPVLLDSLRRSTASLVALERAQWAAATGERPEALPIPLGERAPALTADYWFPGEAGKAPRPTPGRVSLVLFLDHTSCIVDGASPSATQMGGCAANLTRLRRVSLRFPALELTVVVPTRGHFLYAQPPSPAEEAQLLHQWFDTYAVPGATLGVTSTPFWRLPAPDTRRIDKDLPNALAYGFNKKWGAANGGMYLIDQDGLIVDVLRFEESELTQYIDVLLQRQQRKEQ